MEFITDKKEIIEELHAISSKLDKIYFGVMDDLDDYRINIKNDIEKLIENVAQYKLH